MSEKKELNQEQLEKVTGGGDDWGEKMSKYLPSSHGPHICKDDAKKYIGQDFYIVSDEDREKFYWGTLIASDDDVHTVFCKGHNDYFFNGNYDGKNHGFNANWHTLFLFN